MIRVYKAEIRSFLYSRLFYVVFFSSFVSLNAVGQTIPVGLLEDIEDNFRRQQLLGNDSSGSSFMIRPLDINTKNKNLMNGGSFHFSDRYHKQIYRSSNNRNTIDLLPVVWQQQINTHHPYGMNDGSMIPGRGYQMLISGGVYAAFGPLIIQLQPDYVYAENKKFTEIDEVDNGPDFTIALSRYRSRIDAPDRFGAGQYSKLGWGQSSVKLRWGVGTLGLSNENLWWGPGIRSSLLMSNNASGFKHLTLNTNTPIFTSIGAFEAQLIAGRLDTSGVPLFEGRNYRPKEKDWRYISGFVFTYQPKWLKGLYLGASRTFTINASSLGNGFADYLPVFSSFKKGERKEELNGITEEDAKLRDQRISIFMRWILPESNSEIYFEYGKNDHNFNIRDLLVEPEHSRAYIVGYRKLIPLKRPDSYIQLGAEITELEGPPNTVIRPGDYWYAHGTVSHGYTQKGQVLGAGIGSGSNLQSLDASWIWGMKRVGLTLERTFQNNDLYYEALLYFDKRKWIDYSFTGKLDWDFKSFIFNSQITYIRSSNYQYQLHQIANNFHIKIGLMYLPQ